MNVPQLRFSGFDGEWEEISLGEVLEESKELKEGKSSLPIATSSRKGLFLQSDYFNGKRSYDTDEINFKVVPRGYVTYRHMSDDSTFHFNINQLADEILVSPEYPVFTTNCDADVQFILYHLNSQKNFKKFCVMQKLGGTRTRLYFKKLQNYKMLLPSIGEQQKISSYITLFNQKIGNQKEKIEKLEQFKKGMMQKIFSQELRFRDEDGGEFGEWEEYELKELVDFCRNGLSLTQSSKKSRIKVTRIETISEGKINLSKVGYVSTEKDISSYKLKVSDILFSNINSVAHIGKVAIVDKDYNLYHGMNLLCIRTNISNEGSFLFYSLSQEKYKSYFQKICNQAVNQASINQTELLKTKLSRPTLKEQKKVASFFLIIDSKVEKEKEKMMVLEEQKRGFMQGMFV